jgi:hypothetical protein
VTSAMKVELRGLEPDNLLAFIAMLGLLRALEADKPEWRARIHWQGEPLVAVLELASPQSTDEVVRATDGGIRRLGRAYVFDKPDINYTTQEFRALAIAAQQDMQRSQLVAALASDGVKKRKEDTVMPTPLCAMFGQGHQHFLSRLVAVANRDHPGNMQELAQALYEPWRYEDNTDNFRWDPIEDRRYAYQFGDPSNSKNQIGTVTGANRLASIGFAIFATVPQSSGLATVGVAGRGRARDICWPIVAAPTSLAGHIALLAHPYFGDEDDAPELASYGVKGVARARRFSAGKFLNFERARLQVW